MEGLSVTQGKDFLLPLQQLAPCIKCDHLMAKPNHAACLLLLKVVSFNH